MPFVALIRHFALVVPVVTGIISGIDPRARGDVGEEGEAGDGSERVDCGDYY
jgi:hypothetical protein